MKTFPYRSSSASPKTLPDLTRWVNGEFVQIEQALLVLLSDLGISFGDGTPEGVVTAPVGSLFRRTDGGAGTSLYVKESGTGNTGWVAK